MTSSHPLLKFSLIARCAILSDALTVCLLAWFVPMSITAKMIAPGDTAGVVILVLFTACALIGVVDVIINDLLPPSIMLRSVFKRRYAIYNVLAVLYFVRAFAGVGDSIGLDDVLPLSYLMTGFVAAWYSWASAIKGENVQK